MKGQRWSRIILSRRKVILQFDNEADAQRFHKEVNDAIVRAAIAAFRADKAEEEL